MTFTVHEVGTGDLGAGSAIPSAWNPQILDQLDDEGDFTINVQADDPGHPAAIKGRLFQAWIDGDPIWTGLITGRRVRPLGQGARRFTTLRGPGQVKVMERNKVYPRGLGRFPFGDDRTFDWTAPEFDHSGWDLVVVTPANYGTPTENYGLPEGFPDGDAEWIGAVDSSGSVDPGTWHLWGEGTALTTRVRELWGAADDTFRAWLNGEHMMDSAATAYVGKTSAIEVLVSAGAVGAAVEFTNLNNLKAGALLSLLTPLDDTEAPVLHTDATWLVRPSAAPLGMNAGEILINLFDEADARGEIVPAVTFTAVEDSNGDPWTIFEQLTVRIGDSYWDVLRQMVDLQMCEFRMTAGSYELNLFNADGAGTASGVTLAEGTNLKALEFDDVEIEASKLLVRWERGFIEVEDSGLISAVGEQGGFLALGGVRSSAAAQSQAAKVLTRLGAIETEVEAGFDTNVVTDEPYQIDGCQPGDTLTAPTIDGGTSTQRVMEIRTTRDSTGRPQFALTLDSVIAQRGKRTDVTLRRLATGTLGGNSATATIPYQPRPVRPRDPETVKWSEPGPVVAQVGAPATFERAIRVRELRVDLAVASTTGDIEVVLRKDGAIVATCTVAEDSLQGYIPVTDVVYSQRPANVMTVEVTDPGSGADTITITVVYA